MSRATRLRQHPRVPYRTDLWIGQDSIFRRADGEVIDLNRGGACLRLGDMAITVGDVVDLRFALPDDPRVIACSVLVRNGSVPGTVGVEFLSMCNGHRQRLDQFVDTLRVA